MCIPVLNLKSIALLVLEICLRECQILSGSRDLGYAPFRENLSLCCSGLPILSSVPNIAIV